MNKRRVDVHLVSDSTGEMIERIARACLCQFAEVEAQQRLWPFVNRPQRVEQVLAGIAEQPGIVLCSLLDKELRRSMRQGCQAIGVVSIDVLGPVLQGLARHLRRQVSNRPGKQHRMDAEYFARVEAMQRAFLNEIKRELKQ